MELYNSPPMPSNERRNQLGVLALKRGERAGFITSHQSAIASDIGSEYRGQTAFHRHPRRRLNGSFLAQTRRAVLRLLQDSISRSPSAVGAFR
jgi:hypothetical protein